MKNEELIFALCRSEVFTDKDLRLFAVWCAREALKLDTNPDARSVEACNVAERFANGNATSEELAAAGDAAWEAAGEAARAAAWAAATTAGYAAVAASWAARAAGYAARDAAWDAGVSGDAGDERDEAICTAMNAQIEIMRTMNGGVLPDFSR